MSASARKERMQMPGFPPMAAETIMRFLQSDSTGTIRLDIKKGEITGCMVSSYIQTRDHYLDDTTNPPQHNDN